MVLVAVWLLAGSPTRATAPLAPDVPRSNAAAGETFGVLGAQAIDALVAVFYAGDGLWRDCPSARCWVHNSDWGSDALTDTLALRWATARDARVPPLLRALAATARQYPAPCEGRRCLRWSDVPNWDAIADAREYRVLGERSALQKAEAAFWTVEGSGVYALGACPAIRYQRPFGRGDRLKTLETDSNAVKAALLLFEATHARRYLRVALVRYAAIRRYFLDPALPLYSVYVFDDGRQCTQIPRRFFASVNGNMIWDGLRLYRITRDERYRSQALATARAVARDLSDSRGVFADLQAENDLSEPLIEAMFALASQERSAFARRWIVRNAAAAVSARKADGSYGRFFDGPPPLGPTTAWQSSGGFALEVAAAALAPRTPAVARGWTKSTFVPDDLQRLPATIEVSGSGIALIGTLGDRCCQPGHARVFVDGEETVSRVGVWQNKSSSGRRFPGSVLFAWRWPSAGRHEITLEPGRYDAKEGGPFLHLRGYLVR